MIFSLCRPGAVFYDKRYVFDDGGTADKLVVLLNDVKRDNLGLFALATTSESWIEKVNHFGCYTELSVYHWESEKDFFDYNTVILLGGIKERNLDYIKQWSQKETVNFKDYLRRETLDNIYECIRFCKKVIRKHKKIILEYGLIE